MGSLCIPQNTLKTKNDREVIINSSKINEYLGNIIINKYFFIIVSLEYVFFVGDANFILCIYRLLITGQTKPPSIIYSLFSMRECTSLRHPIRPVFLISILHNCIVHKLKDTYLI